MRYFRITFLVAMMLIACGRILAGGEDGNVNAPNPTPVFPGMTLAELEAIAEQHNPTLVQASARLQALRGTWLQSGLHPNPRVGYQAREIGDEGQAGQQGVYFGQEIVTAGKLQHAREVANRAIQQAEWECTAQRQRVLNDVRRAFYDVLAAQRSMELTDRLVHIGQEGVAAAESLFKAQEVSRVDILQARIEAESAGIMSQKARNRHISAWRNLVAILGVTDMPLSPLTGDLQDDLPGFEWEEMVQRLLANSPVLAESRMGVCKAEAVLRRECSERIPNVDLEAGVMYDNATQDGIAEVQVGMPLPLFNRNQGNIRKAQAELSAARCEVRRVELELRQRLTGTFEQYRNARFQVEKYAGEILPNAQTTLDLVAEGYRQGEFDYVALLTAQRTYFHAQLAYLDAIRDLRSSVVALEGYLLSDSLSAR